MQHAQNHPTTIRDRLRHEIGDSTMPLVISDPGNGWSTGELMERYLECLSDKNGQHYIHLLWDCHFSHGAEKVQNCALKHHIYLHHIYLHHICLNHIYLQYIPAGQTGTWHPLDGGIFDGLKSKAVAALNETVAELGPGGERNMDIYAALQILWQIWKGLEPSSVQKAWSRLI